MDKIELAELVATVAHGATGQRRKHSGIKYINHPRDVVTILTLHSTNLTRRMVCAAWLHDVIEDTHIEIDFINAKFGIAVARMVHGLSNDKSFAGNRAERHAHNVKRLSNTAADVKTIKLADCIANMRDVIREDPKFAPVYIAEKRHLVDEALRDGCPVLWAMADEIITEYLRNSIDKKLAS